MSIVSKKGQDSYPYPEICFYCGKKLKYPCVHWMGASGGQKLKIEGTIYEPADDICLHVRCVGMLFTRLMRDVDEIQGGPNG